jgi:hypothetical protein
MGKDDSLVPLAVAQFPGRGQRSKAAYGSGVEEHLPDMNFSPRAEVAGANFFFNDGNRACKLKAEVPKSQRGGEEQAKTKRIGRRRKGAEMSSERSHTVQMRSDLMD